MRKGSKSAGLRPLAGSTCESPSRRARPASSSSPLSLITPSGREGLLCKENINCTYGALNIAIIVVMPGQNTLCNFFVTVFYEPRAAAFLAAPRISSVVIGPSF